MKTFITPFVLFIVFSFTQVRLQAQPQPVHTFQIERRDGITDTLPIRSAVISYDGTKLAAGSGSGLALANIWDVRSGRLIVELEREEQLAEVNFLQFSLDGSLIIGRGFTFGTAPIVVVWNAETGEIEENFTLPDKRMTFPYAASAVITPDNRQALIGNDGELSLWDIQTGELIQDHETLSQTFPEFENVIWPIKFFPDGQRIAVSDGKRGLVILNWQTGAFLQGFTGSSVTLSFDFKSVIVQRTPYKMPREVRIWDTETREIVNEFTLDIPDGNSIQFHPNRTLFLRTGGEGLNVERVLPSKAVERVATLDPGVSVGTPGSNAIFTGWRIPLYLFGAKRGYLQGLRFHERRPQRAGV